MNRSLLAVGAAFALCHSAALAGATLLAHWKLDAAPGASAVMDSSPSGFHGVLANTATFATGGISGNCLSFVRATSGYADMGDILGFGPGASFTICAWIKTTTLDADLPLSRHNTGTLNGHLIGVNSGSGYGSPNKAYTYVSNAPGASPFSTTTVNDGQWRHVALTYGSGGELGVFVNAKRESVSGASPFVPNNAAFLLGGVVISGVKTGVYTGLLDDVQVYNGVLTGPQMCEIFNNPGQTALPHCAGDVNRDGVVNFFDLNLVLSNFGTSGVCQSTDLNGDGSTNFADLNTVLGGFGQPC